jgi:hypothetical protein
VITEQELRDEIVGHELPEGSYAIEPYVHWLMADAVISPDLPDGIAHPMFVYYAGQGGMGVTLDEMFALAHATSDDGVMLGSAELDLRRPLEVGERFTVRGEIDAVVRKQGRIGTFDIVTFHTDLVDGDDAVAAVCTLSFIYPRRG